MRSRFRHLLLLPIVVTTLAAPMSPASACPNCKEAYMDDDKRSLAAGYSDSIMLMMGVPFLVLGGFALRIAISARRQRRAEAAAARGSLQGTHSS